jgi:hypothetical protein
VKPPAGLEPLRGDNQAQSVGDQLDKIHEQEQSAPREFSSVTQRLVNQFKQTVGFRERKGQQGNGRGRRAYGPRTRPEAPEEKSGGARGPEPRKHQEESGWMSPAEARRRQSASAGRGGQQRRRKGRPKGTTGARQVTLLQMQRPAAGGGGTDRGRGRGRGRGGGDRGRGGGRGRGVIPVGHFSKSS